MLKSQQKFVTFVDITLNKLDIAQAKLYYLYY